MTRYVIDASVAIKWVIEEPGTRQAVALRGHRLEAPDLLIPECTNILWKKVRRDELSDQEAMIAGGLLRRADVWLEAMSGLMEPALTLALRLGHAAYDCFYVALAQQQGCPLVTADDRLVRRARDAGLGSTVLALMSAES